MMGGGEMVLNFCTVDDLGNLKACSTLLKSMVRAKKLASHPYRVVEAVHVLCHQVITSPRYEVPRPSLLQPLFKAYRLGLRPVASLRLIIINDQEEWMIHDQDQNDMLDALAVTLRLCFSVERSPPSNWLREMLSNLGSLSIVSNNIPFNPIPLLATCNHAKLKSFRLDTVQAKGMPLSELVEALPAQLAELDLYEFTLRNSGEAFPSLHGLSQLGKLSLCLKHDNWFEDLAKPVETVKELTIVGPVLGGYQDETEMMDSFLTYGRLFPGTRVLNLGAWNDEVEEDDERFEEYEEGMDPQADFLAHLRDLPRRHPGVFPQLERFGDLYLHLQPVYFQRQTNSHLMGFPWPVQRLFVNNFLRHISRSTITNIQGATIMTPEILKTRAKENVMGLLTHMLPLLGEGKGDHGLQRVHFGPSTPSDPAMTGVDGYDMAGYYHGYQGHGYDGLSCGRNANCPRSPKCPKFRYTSEKHSRLGGVWVMKKKSTASSSSSSWFPPLLEELVAEVAEVAEVVAPFPSVAAELKKTKIPELADDFEMMIHPSVWLALEQTNFLVPFLDTFQLDFHPSLPPCSSSSSST